MPPSPRFVAPTQLLADLGIDSPQDIDVEAIAQYCRATIVYAPLTGCEARIIGYGDRAIITINRASSPERRRFSAGHELGHWAYDRGTASLSCTDGQLNSEWMEDNPEKRANRYAADLLMPVVMFRHQAGSQPVTFDTVDTLAAAFRTSLTATAIRLVEQSPLPSMVVCSDSRRKRWFTKSAILPDNLWPHEVPGKDTIAYDLHRNGEPAFRGPTVVNASQWIKHQNAGRYVITEDSRRVTTDLVLTLLWWKDERQLLDLDEEQEDDEREERDPFDFD